MSDSLNTAEISAIAPDRRAQTRQSIRSLAYVDLGFGNGGIILNISESGLAVRSVTPLMESSVPKMSFRPSASKPPIDVAGEITWKGESNTMVGVRFVELPEESRTQIREWMELESAPIPASADRARYSFEPRLPRPAPGASGSSSNALHPPEVDAVADRKASAGAAATVIPIRPSEPETGNATASIAAPDIVSTDAVSSPQSLAAEETPVPQNANWKRAKRRTEAIAAFFAAISLAAGWAVGRGVWNRPSAKFETSTSGDVAAAADAAASGAIEVIDSSDHRWIVPFSTSTVPRAPARQNSPSTSGGNAAPTDTNPPPLRIWMPSAPIVSQSRSGQQPTDAALATSAPPDIDVKEPPTPLLHSFNESLPAPVAYESSGYRDGRLIHRVDPIYPDLARNLNVEGVVKLRLEVAADGKVSQVQVLSGPKLLLPAAVAAVRQWRYEPALLDGKPTEVEKEVDVQFHLPR
ncbi:MAG TPA: TonB family protein [Candidatus Acidoferrales bacterium]|nr:TonB family protein [Candidatus Acidoferrales bacterium]